MKSIVRKNCEAVDRTLDGLHEVKVPQAATSQVRLRPPVPEGVPDFVDRVTGCNSGRPGRPTSGQCVPGGWNIPDRHSQVRKTEYRRRRFRSGIQRFAFSVDYVRLFVRMLRSARRRLSRQPWTAARTDLFR